MRIALFTSGRFHLLDLSRELIALGHEVRFYSLVPPSLTRGFDLPPHANRWLGPYVAPAFAATKLPFGESLGGKVQDLLRESLDRAAARKIEACDVLVAMSGLAVEVLDAAKRRHGARVFLERASRHILSQREILEAIPGVASPVSTSTVVRELAGYALADTVDVPAGHVRDSFLERGFPESRLFVNPFGVDIEVFRPTAAPCAATPKTILMTGSWSLRKGCDLLVEAWRKLPGTRLLHVGSLADAPVPDDPMFVHFDAVPQRQLTRFYGRAHVFALASREEGLAYVQPQALASGLKIVCTTRTGGADLKRWALSDDAISVVPHDDVDALSEALARALDKQPAPGTVRDLLGDQRRHLSWRAYAERFLARVRA